MTNLEIGMRVNVFGKAVGIDHPDFTGEIVGKAWEHLVTAWIVLLDEPMTIEGEQWRAICPLGCYITPLEPTYNTVQVPLKTGYVSIDGKGALTAVWSTPCGTK